MAIHSSILAWRIPWTEEPGGLQSVGSQRVGHDWASNTTLLLLLVVVQSLSCVQLFMTPWTAACRLLCPSLSPGVYLNSYPLNQWCHPTVSSSITPFISCRKSFPALRSFPMSQLSTSCRQIIGASTSVLPVNIQDWFPLGLVCLISLLSKELSRVFSTTIWKYQFFSSQLSLWSSSHIHTWLPGIPQLWLYGSFSAKWCLCLLTCGLGLL